MKSYFPFSEHDPFHLGLPASHSAARFVHPELPRSSPYTHHPAEMASAKNRKSQHVFRTTLLAGDPKVLGNAITAKATAGAYTEATLRKPSARRGTSLGSTFQYENATINNATVNARTAPG
jgi:hypothetical protein